MVNVLSKTFKLIKDLTSKSFIVNQIFHPWLCHCIAAEQPKTESDRTQQGDHVHEEAAAATGSQQPVAAGGHHSPWDRVAALQTGGQEEPQSQTMEHIWWNGGARGECPPPPSLFLKFLLKPCLQ